MKRLFDILVGILLLLLLSFLIFLIIFIVRLTSKGSAIYWSDRVGKDNVIFKMPKFRSMLMETPDIASHLLDNPENYLSPIGAFLRRNSLDEIPQLYSVIKGDMSFVGPRPALYNQQDLINLRNKKGVNKLVPGITGWAQVNGRDGISIPEKVDLDEKYMNKQTFWFDLKILWMTFLKVIKKDNILH
jgi:O-antigen biosynthesis protein WbqP